MTRFIGTIEEFCQQDVTAMIAWIAAIPLEDWPQQTKTELKPSMVTDAGWHNFHLNAKPIAENISIAMLGSPDKSYNHMLSCVMPGHFIEPHKDEQAPDWLCRIHVPLVTNPGAITIMDDGEHFMEVGKAYKMNVLATHAVENRGETPRIHFMFDMR